MTAPSDVLTLAELPTGGPTAFALTPDAGARKALAATLELTALKKLRFEGTIEPSGKADWVLKARLGATVVQPCVVTLEPVTTRIDADVARRYMKNPPEVDLAGESEMPEDDTIEALPAQIDLGDLMTEALALHLPDYPRADGVELGDAVFAEPGVAPLTDETARPFAGLAELRDKLEK